MDIIRILIADDHLFYREGIKTLLQRVSGAEVVGEAATGEEAIIQAEILDPDVILMDVKMPGLNGIAATRRILHARPSIAILVVTMFEDDDSVFAAMRAGARGYLLKDANQEELAQAIQVVSRGQAIFSPTIAQRMIRYFNALSPELARAIPPAPFPELTERERDVLSLIAQGYSNAVIANRLIISQKTVQNHISNIFTKLQVVDRAQAIIRAKEAGMG